MPADQDRGRLSLRHLSAVLVGNALEFYDFLTFSFFALQIGRTFFPSRNPLSSLLLSLATFGAGFLTRPLGAVVLGRVADRRGRRPAMMLSFLLMGIALCGVALTPSYAAIGVAAPLMVLAWRLVQGFALGGEVGPTTAFLIEAAPRLQRGFYGSLQTATQAVAIIMAGLVGFGLSSVLDGAALDHWGWRIAFLVGAAVVPVGFVIRRSLPETLHMPQAESVTPQDGGTFPLATALVCLGLLAAGTVLTYARTYMTTYAVNTLGMSTRVSFVTTILVGAASCMTFIGGRLSDRIGRKPVMLGFTVLTAVCTMPAFLAIVHYRTPAALYVGTTLLTLCTVTALAPILTTITELLPRRVRAGGLGLLYALAISVFGGTTQFIIAWLIGRTGSALVPAWYMEAAIAVGLCAMAAVRETAPVAAARALHTLGAVGTTS
ncbi:MAG TPA: MFS transporter [Steroidobacteraceae bacterium]